MKDEMMIVALKGRGKNGPPPKLGMPGMGKMHGAENAPPPKAKPQQAEDEPDGEGRAVPPEAVSFRTSGQTCSNCEYMGEGGMCSWLKFGVDPGDSCNLFEEKAEEPAEHKGMAQEAGPEEAQEMMA